MLHRFGEKLRYLRTHHSFTQRELAHRLTGVTQGHISLLEAHRRTPSLDLVLHIASLFDVSLDYLLFDDIPAEEMAHHRLPGTPGDTTLPRLFGAKLRYLRQREAMTQHDLARRLPAWTQSHISFLEIDRSDPSLELVVALARLFGVSTDYLLRDDIPID